MVPSWRCGGVCRGKTWVEYGENGRRSLPLPRRRRRAETICLKFRLGDDSIACTTCPPCTTSTMSSKSSPSPSREHTPVPVAEGTKKSTKATVEDVAEEQDTANPEPSPETEPKTEEQPAEATSHGWQAIFSPQHGAYYFYNSTTQETTWVNPLQPEASSSAPASAHAVDPSSSSKPPDAEESEAASSSKADPSTATAPTSHYAALQAAAVAQGIDPALAHLDPSLLGAIPGQQTDAAGTSSLSLP
jgi:hypothetical protein